MAFDLEIHELDPVTGYITDKRLGHLVGIEPVPAAPPVAADYPKWVPVHDTYVVRKEVGDAPAHVSVPAWPQYHVNRADGAVTVLVMNEDEEKLAMAERRQDGPVLEQPELHPYEAAMLGSEPNKTVFSAPLTPAVSPVPGPITPEPKPIEEAPVRMAEDEEF